MGAKQQRKRRLKKTRQKVWMPITRCVRKQMRRAA
jgi:hypothetical protein